MSRAVPRAVGTVVLSFCVAGAVAACGVPPTAPAPATRSIVRRAADAAANPDTGSTGGDSGHPDTGGYVNPDV